MLALGDIKIMDMTISGPGSVTTQYLGDLGADVIKVVPVPGSGRANNPFSGSAAEKKGLYSDFMNRNKQCIAINLKSPEGVEAFLKLAQSADVIVEGGRPGAAKRMGVDYESVKKVNPRIIYCSLSGYGQEGSYAQAPGHDINYIGYAGLLSIIGELDGPPVVPSNFLADFGGAAVHGVVGITVALLARERTGKGQFVDISFTDTAIALNSTNMGIYLSTGHLYDRGGMPTSGGYPCFSCYQTKDGNWLTLGAFEPWFWENTCKVLGLEQYMEEGKLPTTSYFEKRPTNPKYPEIRKALEDKFRTRDRDEWVALLQKNDIPAGPVYDIAEVVNDPVLKQRNVIEVDVPDDGSKVRHPGFPIKFSDTPAQFRRRAPGFGEHTDELLKSVGYTAEQIARLRQSRAVA